MKTSPHKRRQETAARPKRRPAPSKVMTWDKLEKMIAAGHGQGHRRHYQAWLQVTRSTKSTTSELSRLPAPELGRDHHLISREERTTLLILKWLGAWDVREQYPAWPWAHPHPAVGLPGARHEQLPGLMDVAADLRIDHGVYVGTRIPYVATMDFVSTWKTPDGKHKLVVHECKPLALMTRPRVQERLHLTGRYCELAGLPRHIVHAETFPKQLGINLDALRPTLDAKTEQEIRATPAYQTLLGALRSTGTTEPPSDIIDRLAKGQDRKASVLHQLLHMALWHQDVDHDLSQILELHLPLRPGGQALRERMRQSLLGTPT